MSWSSASTCRRKFERGLAFVLYAFQNAEVPWLMRDGRVLASLEVASSRADRRRGLLSRDGFEGALLIEPARSVHTIGMHFAIDVAHLDGDGVVLRTRTMPRNRIGMPVLRARKVLEAEAGCFARWGLEPGQALEVRTTHPDHTGT